MTIETLFDEVRRTNIMFDGWCDEVKALTLASIIVAYRPEISLELGVYGGRSLVPMALAHKAVKRGKVIGVDPWSKAIAVAGQPTEADRKWWADLDIEKIYRDFTERIGTLDVQQYVEIKRTTSERYDPPVAVGLLHIDGLHDKTAIYEAMKFGPRVKVGGFCVVDDLDMFGNHTNAAARRLEGIGFQMIYRVGTGCVMQRTK